MLRQKLFYGLIYLSGVLVIATIGLTMFLWGTSLRRTEWPPAARPTLMLAEDDVDQVWFDFVPKDQWTEPSSTQPALFIGQNATDSQPAHISHSTDLNRCQSDQAKDIQPENGQTLF